MDNVAIDGVQVPDGDGASLDAWQSATEFNPVEVEGYTVQLVAYDSAGGGDAHLFSIPVDDTFHGSLSGTAVADAIGTTADVVAAILREAREDPTIAREAPYTTPVRRLDEAAAAKRPVIRQVL